MQDSDAVSFNGSFPSHTSNDSQVKVTMTCQADLILGKDFQTKGMINNVRKSIAEKTLAQNISDFYQNWCNFMSQTKKMALPLQDDYVNIIEKDLAVGLPQKKSLTRCKAKNY